MRRSLAIAIALGCLFGAGSVRAHHSFARFDMDKSVQLTGTLIAVDWRNPHIGISIDVRSDQGPMQTWVLEGGPPARFRDRGITKDHFAKAIGETLTIGVGPAKDGSRQGHLLTITWPDGTTIPAR
jgi:hypothetical protein